MYRQLLEAVREQLAELGEWPSSPGVALRVLPGARAISSLPPATGRGSDPRF